MKYDYITEGGKTISLDTLETKAKEAFPLDSEKELRDRYIKTLIHREMANGSK